MSKTIVFCADGSWNGPDGQPDCLGRTNVYKVFANLAGSPDADPTLDEQERTVTGPAGGIVQIAKYLHGVGDSQNALVKFLGGAVGAGLIARIIRGYTFISRNYQPGDKIFIIGFSRGAYTARALAGLISAKGLLDGAKADLSDKFHAYMMALAVWYVYRFDRFGHAGFLGSLIDRFGGIMLDPSGANRKLIAPVPIEVVAVWDTVGSMGIPIYADGATLDYFKFADRALSPGVKTGLHASALDEQRETFTPTLWDDDPRVTQVLFTGSHSDVGGGYPDPGLADITYDWMAKKLQAAGLAFANTAYVPNPDVSGMAHRPWLPPLWQALGVSSRVFPANVWVHGSVFRRGGLGGVRLEAAPPTPYKPDNTACFPSDGPFPPDQIDPYL